MYCSDSLDFRLKCLFLGLSSALTLTGFGASAVNAQMTDADVYEHVIKPQEQKRAGEVADILARPSNWGPGEIRSNGNYGGIAWYAKGGGDYGYIVARGFISPTSARIQMEMECDERKVACEGTRPISNQWLAIGKHRDKVRYVTAGAETRAAAEAMVLEQCKAEGAICVIQDVFNIMPHKRGISNLRPKVVQK